MLGLGANLTNETANDRRVAVEMIDTKAVAALMEEYSAGDILSGSVGIRCLGKSRFDREDVYHGIKGKKGYKRKNPCGVRGLFG